MRVIFLCIFSLLLTAGVSAQVQLRAYFARDTVLLGDTVGLNYEILVQPQTEVTTVDLSPLDSVFTMEQMQAAISDTTINWTEVFNSQNQFEILNYGKWSPPENNRVLSATELKWQETEGKGKGQRILSNRMTVTFWDEGTFVVPNAKIGYRSGNRAGVYDIPGAANKVKVLVPTVVEITEVDTLTQLTPIKPIQEADSVWQDYMWAFLLFGLTILGALIYYFFFRKEVIIEEVEEPEIILPSHVIALQKLEALEAADLWQQGAVKEYQSRLTYVLREYLEGRYNIQALESTTGEINEALRKSEVTEDRRHKIRELLQVADLVKFAKAEPPETFHARVLQESKDFVEETKIIEPTETPEAKN